MRLNESARRWLPWLLLAMAAIVTAGAYWPGLTGGWVFDDYPNIVQNRAVHITAGHSTVAAWVNAALSSPASFLHRPLASITFALNWMAGNGDPRPFKLTNVVIHLLNGVLLFCMLRALLRFMTSRQQPNEVVPSPPGREGRGTPGEDPHTRDDTAAHENETTPVSEPSPPTPLPRGAGSHVFMDESAATRLALIVAAAWMLLPINLMAVLYVVQRMESLCQVFVLAGLWAYLHGRWMMLTAGGNAKRDRRGFSLSAGGIVLGTLLGLTSKETAVLLPVFAFLAEWALIRFAHDLHPLSPRGRDRGERPDPRTSRDAVTAGPGMTNVLEAGDSLPGHPGATRSTELGIQGEVRRIPNGNHRQDRRIWTLFTITLFVPAVLGFAWILRGVLRPGALAGRDFTLVQRLMTEPRVLVDYLHWTLLPNPMVLSLYHDEIVISTGLLSPWTTLGAILLLAALIAVAILLHHRRPLIALGIGWFFAAQLLTATIVPLELVYEQRMYFGSIGVLLAVGALLLGTRWRIRLSLLRGFLVAVALLWFGTATYLRAEEWSNPLRLAVAEANRHPESPRAVYEGGRLLLIASNYEPGKELDAAWKYLRQASAIPGSSSLPDQAMIMIVDHGKQGADAPYWHTMIHKLREQPTKQEDISALVSLTNCYGSGICKFDRSWLERAYQAALSRPHPIARLYGAYAAFQRDQMHDDAQATKYLALAVQGDPDEPAYRVDLAALYARQGQTEKAVQQIDALRRMNVAGRLNGQINTLERLIEGANPPTGSN